MFFLRVIFFKEMGIIFKEMSRDEVYLLILYCGFTTDIINAFFIESQGEMWWHLCYCNRLVEFSIINLYVTFILKPSVLY